MEEEKLETRGNPEPERKDPREKVIVLKNVKKIYHMGKERVHAVDGVSFEIYRGEFCCLLGTSGSGKSTLLNLMAGIEKASGGEILIKGKSVRAMSENTLAKFRQKNLGFVFQSYNLIASMNAVENVEFPLVFKRVPPKRRRALAEQMLRQVGLADRMQHLPKEMSGGQQQRVGIARAFVARPEIVFADEPTGNLDTKTTMEVMDLIHAMARRNRQTIVMVTHDPRLAEYADKIINILDGKIQSVEVRRSAEEIEAECQEEIRKYQEEKQRRKELRMQKMKNLRDSMKTGRKKKANAEEDAAAEPAADEENTVLGTAVTEILDEETAIEEALKKETEAIEEKAVTEVSEKDE